MTQILRVAGAVLALWCGVCWAAVTIVPTVDVLLFTLPGGDSAPCEVAVAPLTPFCALTGATCLREGTTFTVTRGERTFRCTLGKHAASFDKDPVTLVLVPWLVEGEPYVPLLALVEALGGTTRLPGAAYTVTLPGMAQPLVLREARVADAPGKYTTKCTDQLYRINLDGTGLRRVSYVHGAVADLRVSPKGTSLLYTYNGSIYVRAVDSPRERVVLASPPDTFYDQLSFSPDGARILYVKNPGRLRGQPQIGLVNVDGTHPRLLAAGNAPTWSPDGRSIAFLRLGGKTVPLYLIRADGTGLRRLSADGEAAAFSPDGSRLCYTRPSPWGTTRKAQIFIVTLTGAQAGSVYTPPRLPGDAWAVHSDSVLSPDRNLFAYADDQQAGIFAGKCDQTPVWRVTPPNALDHVSSPCFTPDGQRIVFIDSIMGDCRLVVVSLRDGKLRWLMDGDRNHPPTLTVHDYDLLPDGKTVLFTAERR
ncbi:MAG TPA: hypothetical protein VGM23_16190 [Armatimonadota bacterium]|jgi:hypothetical protein